MSRRIAPYPFKSAYQKKFGTPAPFLVVGGNQTVSHHLHRAPPRTYGLQLPRTSISSSRSLSDTRSFDSSASTHTRNEHNDNRKIEEYAEVRDRDGEEEDVFSILPFMLSDASAPQMHNRNATGSQSYVQELRKVGKQTRQARIARQAKTQSGGTSDGVGSSTGGGGSVSGGQLEPESTLGQGQQAKSDTKMGELNAGTFDTATISVPPPMTAQLLTPRMSQQCQDFLQGVPHDINPPTPTPFVPVQPYSPETPTTYRRSSRGARDDERHRSRPASSSESGLGRSDNTFGRPKSNVFLESSQTNHQRRKMHQTGSSNNRGGNKSAEKGEASGGYANETEVSAIAAQHSQLYCQLCRKLFRLRGDLQRHMQTVHQKRKMYTCEECHKPFGHSGHLNRHVNSVHRRQRRFPCQRCDLKFFQRSHLSSHIESLHTDTSGAVATVTERGEDANPDVLTVLMNQ